MENKHQMAEANKKELELYIHIPFCIKKCLYCDFLSAPSSEEERQEYMTSLCRQIRSYGELAKAYHVISIFVGGGTPSILEAVQIQRLFEAVRDTFRIDPGAEITIEVNPGTVTEEKLTAYRSAGINRMSIGLQSAKDEELERLGRIHTYGEFLDTYRMAREKGFRNINVDLMSAIPGQTEAGWEETLRRVAELGPEHISAYSLIIEEGTPFYEKYGKGPCAGELPDEEEERRMYQSTKRILDEYGYGRYEISNYAFPGYECRHNLGYWNRTEYLGIGTGASSLLDNSRWDYGEEPAKLSLQEQMEEYMFLGLRKMEGVSRAKFEKMFGRGMDEVYGKVLRKMCGLGLLEEAGDFIRLTERGIDVSNAVMCEFLHC